MTCSFPDCGFQTSDGLSDALLHQPPSCTQSHSTLHVKPPCMDRPSLSFDSTAEDWEIFVRNWDFFKRNTGTSVREADASSHLWRCCERSLADALFKQVDQFAKIDEKTLLGTIKALAVFDAAVNVRKASISSSRQDHSQPFRAFAAHIKGTATKAGCNRTRLH